MCVPKMLGMVIGPNWTEHPVESRGYQYPESLTMLLPEFVREWEIVRLKAQTTFKDGVLSVSLHREPDKQGLRIVGAFEITFGSGADDQLEVVVAGPKKLAIFDGQGLWVPRVKLPKQVSIKVFLLDRRFNANWAGEHPLVGLTFTDSFCPLARWRTTLWRWLTYLDVVKEVD